MLTYESRNPRTRSWLLPLLVAAVAMLVSATETAAQTPPEPEPPQESGGGLYDTSVPVGAVRSFIDTARTGDFVQAARHLDLDAVSAGRQENDGPRLARKLKTVLDRKLWIDYETLSDRPEGHADDGLPANLDRVGSIDGADILVERGSAPGGSREWRFAESTVRRIPELYQRYGYGRLGDLLPSWMFEFSFLEIQLWQWLGLLLLVGLAWPLSAIGAWVVFVVLRPIAARTETRFDDELLRATRAPLRLVLAVGFVGAGSLVLALSVPAYGYLGHVVRAAAIVAVTWFGLRFVDIMAGAVRTHLEETGRRAVVSVVPLGRRVAKVFLGAIALVVVLQNVGLDVTGLIAGLGVGGLAVALAAQKSIANLFGGVSLIADQAVRVGDFCKFGGQLGTVEEVGLRSTRVRTLDRTLVTIPNAEFSEMQLENFAARDRIRLHATLGLRYETTPEQLRYLIAEIRRLLVAHPKITETPARVRFVNFGAYSIDLEIFAYVATTNFDEFLQVREDVFLRLMDIVEKAGTGFAFPSQTLYLGRDSGLDAARAHEAEARVHQWRERGELPLPDYPEAALREMENTLDYPPAGSALR